MRLVNGMRLSSCAAFALMLFLVSLAAHGCGAGGELETPSVTSPVVPTQADQLAAQPEEEAAISLHPVDDCPESGIETVSAAAQPGGATRGMQDTSAESSGPAPSDSIVWVNQYSPDEGGERVHIANGVVLAETGYVATALDLSLPLGCFELALQDGTAISARIVAIHRASGAVLLKADVSGISRGVPISRDPVHSETAVHMYRVTRDTILYAIEGAATAANSEALWVLAMGSGPAAGEAFFDSDGALVGVVTPDYYWEGALPSLLVGPPRTWGYPEVHGPHRVFRARSLELLAQGIPDEKMLGIPVRLRFGGPARGWSVPYGDPAAVGEKVDGYLRALDEPAEVDGLGGPVEDIVGYVPLGVQLELVYPAPRPLESSDGRLLGLIRYVMLWWDRGPGKPGLVLAGPEPDHITHAFEVGGLDEFEALARYHEPSYRAPQTLTSTGLPTEYPLRWTMRFDRSSYSEGEPVRINLLVENLGEKPIELQLPSPFELRDSDRARIWWSEFVSDREEGTVMPGETLILTSTWDQTDSEDRQVPYGTYRIFHFPRILGSGTYANSASFEIVE